MNTHQAIKTLSNALVAVRATLPALPLALVMTLAPPAAYADDARNITATVNGMVCAFCAQGIEKKLKAMAETQSVKVDLKSKLVSVAAKPGQQLDPAKVKQAIVDAGYEVRELKVGAAH
jgi:copper chaperone CopZ